MIKIYLFFNFIYLKNTRGLMDQKKTKNKNINKQNL